MGLSVRGSVCPMHCGKNGGSDPDAVWHHRSDGPGMRQVVGFGDRPTGRGTFGGEFGARHCNQWGLYGVCVRQRRDAALFPNYFGQTCYYYESRSVTHPRKRVKLSVDVQWQIHVSMVVCRNVVIC